MMEIFYIDFYYRVYFYNLRIDVNKELYKVLFEIKKVLGSGVVCERNGLYFSSSGVFFLGF